MAEKKEITTKGKIFGEFLEKNEIKCFTKEEMKDDLKTVVYRSTIEVEGNKLPTIIILDNSIYTVLRVQVSPKVKEKEKLTNYLNELNSKYKVFKYYVGADEGLYMDSVMPCTQENFSSELVYTVIDVVVKHLVAEYSNIMKKIWGEENKEKLN